MDPTIGKKVIYLYVLEMILCHLLVFLEKT